MEAVAGRKEHEKSLNRITVNQHNQRRPYQRARTEAREPMYSTSKWACSAYICKIVCNLRFRRGLKAGIYVKMATLCLTVLCTLR